MASIKFPKKEEIKPLNFDESFSEDTENACPRKSLSEHVKCKLEDLSFQDSYNSSYSLSTSLIEEHRHLHRQMVMHSTPILSRVTRKRKYDGTLHTRHNISQMPNEILSQVFSYLNTRDILNAGATCKQFYKLTSSPVIWEVVNFSGKRVLESALHRIISRQAKYVSLTNAVIYADPNLSHRNFAPCALTHLDLSWTKFPDHALPIIKGLLRRCTKLECFGMEAQTVDAELLGLIAQNPELRVLNLSSCQVIDAESLELIFKSCPKLTDLNLSWTIPDAATAEVIIEKMPSTIQRLAIAGMGNREAFNDAGLLKMINKIPDIIELDIGDNVIVGSPFIMRLAELKNFYRLNASRCYNIEPLAFPLLKNVRYIDLFGNLSNAGINYMKDHLPNAQLNKNPFSAIARSQPCVILRDDNSCSEDTTHIFWGKDMREPY